MTITFVGAHATLSNADTVPTHPVNATIFQCAFRSSAATIPTDPGGVFITYDTEAANTCAQRCTYTQATATTGGGATFTGATMVATIVVDGPWGSGGGNAATGASATLNWAAFAIDDTSGNNFLLGFGNSRSATNVQTTAPSGLTAVTTTVSSSAGYTGTTTVNWPSTNQTVNTNTGWITALLELTSYTTFSAIRTATNVTLSNKNLSSQSTSATGDRSVIVTYGRQSGKYVFKITFASGAQVTSGNGAGLCNPSQSPTIGLAGTTNSLGYFFDGSVFCNNTQVLGTTQAAYADGDTVYVAIDIDNKLLWTKNGAGGTWTGNPDAGTGGLNIVGTPGAVLSFTGGILPVRGAGSVETGITTWDGSAAGHGLTTFTPWDGSSSTNVSFNLVKATSAAAVGNFVRKNSYLLSSASASAAAAAFTRKNTHALPAVSSLAHASPFAIHASSSIGLTAVSTAAHASSFSVGRSASVNLASASATAHAASLLSSVRKFLVAVAATGAVGNFNRSHSQHLSSASSTAYAAALVSHLSILLHAATATGLPGQFSNSRTKSLVAVSSTAHASPFSKGEIVHLQAVATLSGIGQFITPGGIQLVSAAALAHAAALVQHHTKALGAAQSSAAAAALLGAVLVRLVAVAASGSAGSLVASSGRLVGLSSVEAFGDVGNFSIPVRVLLDAVAAIAASGSFQSSGVDLLGVEALGNIGEFGIRIVVPPSKLRFQPPGWLYPPLCAGIDTLTGL